METKNPRAGSAGASVSIAADTRSLSQYRPIIQANAKMRARLTLLLFGFPWTWEARHGRVC